MSSSDQPVFVTTRWTRVLAARGDSESARAALSQLCDTYYRPVLEYLRRTGAGQDEPEDVTHEFFASLLARDALTGAEEQRGRFRSYLLGALKHFLSNRHRRAGRTRHGGQTEHLPLAASPEGEDLLPGPTPDLDALFDREWALTVVEGALATLEEEARDAGTLETFAVLKGWLSFADEPGSQSDAAQHLGMTEGAIKVAIHRLRRRFRELVRLGIRETLPAEESPEAELGHLIAALAVRG